MKKDKYQDFVLYKGKRELGLMWSDIKHYLLTPSEYDRFSDFMKGQTCGVLDHQSDDGKEVHMFPFVYVDDYVRFIKDLPVID